MSLTALAAQVCLWVGFLWVAELQKLEAGSPRLGQMIVSPVLGNQQQWCTIVRPIQLGGTWLLNLRSDLALCLTTTDPRTLLLTSLHIQVRSEVVVSSRQVFIS